MSTSRRCHSLRIGIRRHPVDSLGQLQRSATIVNANDPPSVQRVAAARLPAWLHAVTDQAVEGLQDGDLQGRIKVCLVPGCGKTFSTTGNLNRHLKHQHPDLPAGQAPVQVPPPTPMPQMVVTAPQVMPPQFIHRSPTSTEQWPMGLGSSVPVFKPRVTTCWPQQITVQQQQPMLPLYGQQMPQGMYSPTRSCSELFEDVWNSEMLDTLVNVLHDPTVLC
ncbi:unnamed protein product [Phytophthora lilii]|uniref:Unnamed protein product n=1 Tax=Phytophthora lilii TaxID=2077276 RepID=A0A9W6UAE3_9STRA|nr:unnamed protein product [Phytophthora lilii]